MTNSSINKQLLDDPHEVFISYRRKEGWEFALLMERALSARNISVFLDQKDLDKEEHYGKTKWKPVVEFNIEHCKVFVPIFARNTVCYKEDDNHGVDNFWAELDLVKKINEEREAKHKPLISVKPIIVAESFKTKPTEKDFSNWGKTYKQALEHWEYYDKICDEVENKEISQTTALKTINDYVNIIYDDLHKSDKVAASTTRYMDKKMSKEDQEAELERLQRQANEHYYYLKPAIMKVVAEYDEISVLDIGCANGYNVQKILGKNGKVKSIVGLDINEIYLEDANKRYGQQTSQKIVLYEKCNLNETDRKKDDELTNVLDKVVEKTDKFNVVILSLILLHLKDPQNVISTISKYIKPGGTIILNDVDDGLDIFHSTSPSSDEDNEIYAKYQSLWETDEDTGDRHMGRKIHGILRKYFNHIELVYIGDIISSEDDTGQREDDCKSHIALMIEDYTRHLKNTKDIFKRAKYAKAIQWLEDKKSKIIDIYSDEKFFQFRSHLVFTAKKKKE